MLREFRDFALRSKVFDLAVGVIIGGAFGKIVSSFVADILMPPLGLLLGNVNFAELFIDLSGAGYSTLAAAQAAGAPTPITARSSTPSSILSSSPSLCFCWRAI